MNRLKAWLMAQVVKDLRRRYFMENKQWWMSKGVWGGVVGFISMALLVFGIVDIPAGEQVQIVDVVISAVTAVVGLISIIVGIYGRITAKHTLSGK